MGDEVVSGSWLDGFDDLGWVVLALVAAVAGLIAVGSIVWVAPALLAEVLVDALIVSTASRHLADSDRPDWTMTAIRRTWLPATIVILAMVGGGWALQQMAPDAPSIGPALRAITASQRTITDRTISHAYKAQTVPIVAGSSGADILPYREHHVSEGIGGSDGARQLGGPHYAPRHRCHASAPVDGPARAHAEACLTGCPVSLK